MGGTVSIENIIILVIILMAVAFGIRESVKHFKGEGGCCGGGSAVQPKKKKLKGSTLKTMVFSVPDMHCKNCAARVTETVNDIDGAAAHVNLKKKTVTVACDRVIDPDDIRAAIEHKGYSASLIL